MILTYQVSFLISTLYQQIYSAHLEIDGPKIPNGTITVVIAEQLTTGNGSVNLV